MLQGFVAVAGTPKVRPIISPRPGTQPRKGGERGGNKRTGEAEGGVTSDSTATIIHVMCAKPVPARRLET